MFVVICANYGRVGGGAGDRREQKYMQHVSECTVTSSCRRAGERVAAVAPSGWRAPLINELPQPRRLGRARGHTSACHSGLTPSPSPAASRSPRDFPDVPRFQRAAQGVTVARSPS